ncbi:MAG: 23S rRNA (uracil(1939)-C(5))-methyltransferase RlmD, partial [Clostridia bacterium]
MLDRKLRVGEVLSGVVADFGMNGEGIVKLGAYPVFVQFALVGEEVKFKVTYAKRDFAFGDLIEVLSPSNDRIKPVCPYYMRCGGCDMQHIKMTAQQEIKRANLERTLHKIAGFDTDVSLPIHLNDFAYRNKLSLPFGVSASGKVVLGFFEKMTHKVVPMKFCPLHGDWAGNVISALTDWANSNHISVYSEIANEGVLRHAVCRMLDTLTVTIVVNGNEIPNLNSLVENLNKYFKDFTIFMSPNKEANNVILGDTATLQYGEIRKQNLGAFSAEISPLSFLQVNNAVRDALYDATCDNLKCVDGEVLELYSGVGLLTAQIASRLPNSHITAVEIVAEATENANALISSLSLDAQVSNINADAVNYVKDMAVKNADCKNAVILDPPRRGCDSAVINAIIEADIFKVVYISCNPATLSRDIKMLLTAGYEVTYLQPFDMFPET